jgi:hypothetical protein
MAPSRRPPRCDRARTAPKKPPLARRAPCRPWRNGPDRAPTLRAIPLRSGRATMADLESEPVGIDATVSPPPPTRHNREGPPAESDSVTESPIPATSALPRRIVPAHRGVPKTTPRNPQADPVGTPPTLLPAPRQLNARRPRSTPPPPNGPAREQTHPTVSSLPHPPQPLDDRLPSNPATPTTATRPS